MPVQSFTLSRSLHSIRIYLVYAEMAGRHLVPCQSNKSAVSCATDRHPASLLSSALLSQTAAQQVLHFLLSAGQITTLPNYHSCLIAYGINAIRNITFTVYDFVILLAQWLRHYATNRKVSGSIHDEGIFFLIYLIFPATLRTGVYSASNINEYQKHKNKSVFGE
jgi:hypothetical protein